jgi:hypothetical protein
VCAIEWREISTPVFVSSSALVQFVFVRSIVCSFGSFGHKVQRIAEAQARAMQIRIVVAQVERVETALFARDDDDDDDDDNVRSERARNTQTTQTQTKICTAIRDVSSHRCKRLVNCESELGDSRGIIDFETVPAVSSNELYYSWESRLVMICVF